MKMADSPVIVRKDKDKKHIESDTEIIDFLTHNS